MILLFNACAQLRTKEALNLLKTVSKKLPPSSYLNSRLTTTLIHALMKCGDVEHAESIFFPFKNKSLYMYGAMMKGNL